MSTNSKQKGKRGEREFASLLREHGYDARRGQQFSGSKESPDVVCKDLEKLHFEVKRTEQLSLYVAMSQAIGDAGDDKIPVVAHRRNDCEWLLIFRASDILPKLGDMI